jgi:hypothetical protein
MPRQSVLQLVAVVLAAYGIWTALYIPAMLVGPTNPLLLICFVLQVVAALLAAVGLWGDQGWAATAVLVLGAAIAATQLIEVLLGILPYLRAVVVAVLAIVGALLLVRFIRTGRAVPSGSAG